MSQAYGSDPPSGHISFYLPTGANMRHLSVETSPSPEIHARAQRNGHEET